MLPYNFIKLGRSVVMVVRTFYFTMMKFELRFWLAQSAPVASTARVKYSVDCWSAVD